MPCLVPQFYLSNFGPTVEAPFGTKFRVTQVPTFVFVKWLGLSIFWRVSRAPPNPGKLVWPPRTFLVTQDQFEPDWVHLFFHRFVELFGLADQLDRTDFLTVPKWSRHRFKPLIYFSLYFIYFLQFYFDYKISLSSLSIHYSSVFIWLYFIYFMNWFNSIEIRFINSYNIMNFWISFYSLEDIIFLRLDRFFIIEVFFGQNNFRTVPYVNKTI